MDALVGDKESIISHSTANPFPWGLVLLDFEQLVHSRYHRAREMRYRLGVTLKLH